MSGQFNSFSRYVSNVTAPLRRPAEAAQCENLPIGNTLALTIPVSFVFKDREGNLRQIERIREKDR